ncbi:hypothetical protein HMPREF3198_00404 [Winkia neuii]|uniref:hypothetical protein n=1 Tax=Winkia neuii TaxID=33007 RepID=UPI000763FD8F|nr:hypothetical protein [Winkia neuii]KWZ74767.1 hypothetical protein HMPREF3198_00404 [Winkia neuii]
MPLFELDQGRLVPAQFGRPIERGFNAEVLESVRAQVLEVISRPLFPVAWDHDEADEVSGPHRLTALDASGQVVAVEVLGHLDAISLIAALSRLGDISSMGWLDLAQMYPGGAERFRSGWTEFRESMPPDAKPGPRMIIVAANIDPAVRPSLDVLFSSGLEVHEIAMRAMANGRRFLDVQPVGPSYWSPNPALMRSSRRPRLSQYSTDAGRISGPEQRGSASLEKTGGQNTPVQAQPAGSTSRQVPGKQGEAEAARQPVQEQQMRSPKQKDRIIGGIHYPQVYAVGDTVVAQGFDKKGQEPPATTGEHEAVQKEVPAVLGHDAEGLAAIATVLGSDTLIVAVGADSAKEALLLANGKIRYPGGGETDNADAALEKLLGIQADGWDHFRLGHAEGPSLAEAILEINEEIDRESKGR